MIKPPEGQISCMDIADSTNLVPTLHPLHAGKARERKQALTPKDAENVLVVLIISWIFAAATLVYIGKFNLILFMATAGFVAVLVVLCCGLSLLTIIALQALYRGSSKANPAATFECVKEIFSR